MNSAGEACVPLRIHLDRQRGGVHRQEATRRRAGVAWAGGGSYRRACGRARSGREAAVGWAARWPSRRWARCSRRAAGGCVRSVSVPVWWSSGSPARRRMAVVEQPSSASSAPSTTSASSHRRRASCSSLLMPHHGPTTIGTKGLRPLERTMLFCLPFQLLPKMGHLFG